MAEQFFDIVVDSSIANLGVEIARLELMKAAASVPIAGSVLALFNFAYWEKIKKEISERQQNGKVCLRFKTWTVIAFTHFALEVGAPNTAYYPPAVMPEIPMSLPISFRNAGVMNLF